MNLETGDALFSDVFLKLGPAVEYVYKHIKDLALAAASVEAAYDLDHELEGIAFFGAKKELVACITVYRLDRDTAEPIHPAITSACRLTGQDLENALNKLVKA